jgi:hypothetical protein
MVSEKWLGDQVGCTRVAVLAAAVGIVTATMSGCSSEPEPVAVEDFLAGQWECQSVGGSGPQGTDFWVNFAIDDHRIKMEQDGFEATYDYVVTPDGIETADTSGGGWQIEGPLEITEGENFRAFVTSLNGAGTDEQPRLSFEDDGVMVDSFFGYQLHCKKD